jgi:hypothetical protein
MRPGGLMVPSQTRIMLAGMTGERIYEEAFGFWDEVYGESPVVSRKAASRNRSRGCPMKSSRTLMMIFQLVGFDLSAMKPTQFEDGIVEIVDAKEVMTTECALKVGRVNEDGTSESQAEPKTKRKNGGRQADLVFLFLFLFPGISNGYRAGHRYQPRHRPGARL